MNTKVFKKPSKGDDIARINQEITANTVRVIDDEGGMLGVMKTSEAIAKASASGLDLVEVSPNAEPPVCKITDYGKYKYQIQKKKNEAKKKQKIVLLKEVHVGPTIEENDYQVKMRNAKRFLEDGNKVKFLMRFKGRQIAHKEIGLKVLERMKTELLADELYKADQEPRFEGRQIIMVLAPK